MSREPGKPGSGEAGEPGGGNAALPIRETSTGIRFEVRVTPRASKTMVGGVHECRLVVRVTAPPVDQAANDAAIEAIAGTLGIARRAVRIVGGLRSRNKSIEIDGLTPATLRSALAPSQQ